MQRDRRNIDTGFEIPSEGYCDQPYVVVNDDGSWTCLLTTGTGREGESGQHVVATISDDRGRTWGPLYDIEPSDGPEASWVMPLLVPTTGRIYAFYTYNKENRREVGTVDGGVFKRVDSFGVYAYRYSDDKGRTWSRERYEIPMREFACDRENVYGGAVRFFWGVGKPFVHRGAAYVCASKVGGFGAGFFVQNEGVLFRSPNLVTEPDPANHEWETLPDGDVGLRTPEGGGPIAGEFNATPMNDGGLYGTFRTIDGWSCHALSRDDGRTWSVDWMTYAPGGRRVKNPRSANFVRRFSNGRYLYWFCFNGGEVLGNAPGVEEGVAYDNRNPIWLSGGVEREGTIHWSQPEIILYDDRIGNRISYPDFIEDGGRFFITETQKTVARVHELDAHVLESLWNQHQACEPATAGLVLDFGGESCANGASVHMPELPPLHDRDDGCARGGFALELWIRFDDLTPWQVLFDSRGPEGWGLLVQLTDRGTAKLHVIGGAYDTPGSRSGNGTIESACESDGGLLGTNRLHQILFIVDGGPRLMTVMIDGVLCDGGSDRRAGWSRIHPSLTGANGAQRAIVAPDMHGHVGKLRIYDRYLLTSEGVANWRAHLRDGGTPAHGAASSESHR